MKVLASDFLKLTEKMKFPTRSLPRLGPEKPDVHPLRMQEGKRVSQGNTITWISRAASRFSPTAKAQLTHTRGKGEGGQPMCSPSDVLGALHPLPHLQ